MADPMTLQGTCMPQFEQLYNQFSNNFDANDEAGASVCVTVEGETVVDLWGGMATPETPWQQNTVTTVFSATKGATALCAHLLIDQEALGLHQKMADIWPEFARAGKESATVAMSLDHSLGIPVLREPITPEQLYDWEYMVERLAREEAHWIPGSRGGYHAFNFGWQVGELVKRLSGESLGSFFQNRIAQPLKLDFWIGIPENLPNPVAEIIPVALPVEGKLDAFTQAILNDTESCAFRFMRDAQFFLSGGCNSPAARKAQLGGANATTNARGLAGMYAPLANDGGGLIRKAAIQPMQQTSMATQLDATLLMPTRFSSGYMKSIDNRGLQLASAIISDGAFGHVGAGGSIGFADPDKRLSFGYVMNKMGSGLLLNERGQSLVDTTYQCLLQM